MSKRNLKIDNDDGIPEPEITSVESSFVNLTSHTDAFGVDPLPISWGHPDPMIRGPVICTVRHSSQRNAIGAHSGSYCIYTGLAVATKKLDPGKERLCLVRYSFSLLNKTKISSLIYLIHLRLCTKPQVDYSSLQHWAIQIMVRSQKNWINW